MCGSLRRENISKKFGDVVELMDRSGNIIKSRWEGFCRKESLESGKWDKYEPKEGVLPGWKEYTEKGALFKIPEGKAIRAIISKDPRDPDKRKISIVTRPATMDELKEAVRQGKQPHGRHPEVVDVEKKEPKES